MRLFAYGGTRYEVRTRLGDWPSDFTDTSEFEDLASLPLGGGRLAYGVGLRPEPALILRERQSEQDRGGYAYTVLLDPGRTVWERCGWNPARLLVAARGDEQFWHQLLHEPERLVASVLQARLDALALGTPIDASHAFAEFGEALVLTSAADEGMVLSVSPSDPAISPQAMVALLDRLPVAFRCGHGWLIGGKQGVGRTLGTRLTVDWSNGGSDGAAPTPTLDALRAVADNGLSPRLAELLLSPVHEWRPDPSRVVSQSRLLAALAGADRIDDAVADVGPRDELAEDLRRRVIALAESTGTWRYSNAVAAWLLAATPQLADLPRAAGRRLDIGALAVALHERGITPSDPGVVALGLEAADVVALWEAYLQFADRDRVVETFTAAARHLRLAERAADDAAIGRLFKAAAQQRRGGRLHAREWRALRDRQPDVWTRLQPHLTEIAREDVIADLDARLDYLATGSDVGAAWLLQTHGPARVAEIAELALGHLADRHLGPEAREWLEALAPAPARRALPLKLKLRIAEVVDNWRPLKLLMELLEGQQTLTPLQAHDDESTSLVAELGDAVEQIVRQERSEPTALVHLDRIAALIGAEIPHTLLERLVETVSVTDESVRWLREHGHGDLAQRALVDDWRNLEGSCAVAPAADAHALLASFRQRNAAQTELRDLLAAIDAAVLDTVIRSRPEHGEWLTDTLLAPHGEIGRMATLVPHVSPETWALFFDVLHQRGAQAVANVFGAMNAEEAAMPLGRILFSYIAERPELRERVAVVLEGCTWAEVEPMYRERYGAGSTPEPGTDRVETASATTERPRRKRR